MPNVELSAYTRIDAAVFYRVTDSMRLQLNVENLFDSLQSREAAIVPSIYNVLSLLAEGRPHGNPWLHPRPADGDCRHRLDATMPAKLIPRHRAESREGCP